MALKQSKSVHFLQTCDIAVQEDCNATRDNANCSFDSGKFQSPSSFHSRPSNETMGNCFTVQRRPDGHVTTNKKKIEDHMKGLQHNQRLQVKLRKNKTRPLIGSVLGEIPRILSLGYKNIRKRSTRFPKMSDQNFALSIQGVKFIATTNYNFSMTTN